MEHQAITILRYISLLQRNTRRYFDLMLEQDQIGSGQQFFLLRIFENDGISMQDLARLGSFDKGTVTRAVQKLVIEGYVRTEADPQDKRVRHIYLTERARPLIDHVYQIRDYWTEALTRGPAGGGEAASLGRATGYGGALLRHAGSAERRGNRSRLSPVIKRRLTPSFFFSRVTGGTGAAARP